MVVEETNKLEVNIMSSISFGGEIRRLRIEAGRTLKDVATALGGVSVPYVSDIERGRRNPPTLEKIRLLAGLFNCPEEEDRLAELAVLDRGTISMTPKDEEQRQLLVALDRSIQSQSLDPEVIRSIQKILARVKK